MGRPGPSRWWRPATSKLLQRCMKLAPSGLICKQGIDARAGDGAAWAFEMAEAAAGRARGCGAVTGFLQTAFATVVAILQVCEFPAEAETRRGNIILLQHFALTLPN